MRLMWIHATWVIGNTHWGQILEPSIRKYLLTNLYVFVWTAPTFVSLPILGIPAYADGNGTFYWDTCLAVGNVVNVEWLMGHNLVYWVPPVGVIGYENYLEDSTMYYNNGFVVSQLGAIDYYYGYEQYSAGITNTLIGNQGGAGVWGPAPMSGVNQYGVFLLGVVSVIPFIGVNMTLPPGATEDIGNLLSPTETISFNGWTVEVANITWTFNIDYGSNQKMFANAFENLLANLFIPSLTSVSDAEFNVHFDNYVITLYRPYEYFTTETIWVNTTWMTIFIPQSSTVVSIPMYHQQSSTPPSNSYVSGVSSSRYYLLYGLYGYG
ncbi:hypothetical protein [Vulcanisaeta distributa]|uniref:hypothetical protein n=1 Tax=Vulcanisaeta distributa TaxID=164451 RepID=UPI001FB4F6B9|nr:hypothetical protein [Vulcanisaeta distributa]